MPNPIPISEITRSPIVNVDSFMEITKNKETVRSVDTSTAVSLQEKIFLVHGNKQIPISIEFASKYSLSFRYKEGQGIIHPDEPVKFLLFNNGQSVELGPCRILTDEKQDNHHGRLVFLDDVYDIKSLLEDNKIVNLRSASEDLPFIFARKENIKPEFKFYTADLKYDLQVYQNFLDDLDSQYIDEPEEVRRLIQQAIFKSEKDRFNEFLDKKLDDLNDLVSDFSDEEHHSHGYYFRKQLWNFILCCPIFARSNLKPRGYPGDSLMMKMLYLNDYQGNSTFAKLFHKHGVGHQASQSVRNRIKLVGNLLTTFATNSNVAPPEILRSLSVGSGPAFELQEVIKSARDCQRYHFTLLDQDSSAHSEAAELVHALKEKFDCKVNVDYQKCSVRTMLFSKKLAQRMGQFDFIYSMGLFDYLSTPLAKALLKHLFKLLKPGGEMVIGNFHVSNPSKYYMEYWCDWALFHRTENEMMDILPDVGTVKSSVLFENTRSQMFLHLIKPI